MTETVAQYQLLDRLGTGGLGDLYRARDTRVGRTVALRQVHLSHGDRERLLRDASAIASLSHPSVAGLYEAGVDGGQVFLAAEYVPGDTLTKTIAGQPLNPRRAAEFAAQIADGLAEAHPRGFVHGDVRPDNIIVTPKGQAKLIELGLSSFTRAGRERASAPGSVIGTSKAAHGALHYLSPEQALGEPADGRTDVFSLGAVLYAMLTGSPPFRGESAAAVTLAVLQSTPPPPSRTQPDVPHELDAIVARALTKSLEGRYQSIAEMAADLRTAAALIEARAAVAAEEASVSPRPRSPLRTVLVAALVLVLAAIVGWWWVSAH